jgi:hypothetical protein
MAMLTDQDVDGNVPALTSSTEPTVWISTTITEGAPTKDDPAPFRIVTKVAVGATPSMLGSQDQVHALNGMIEQVAEASYHAHVESWSRCRADVGQRRAHVVNRHFPAPTRRTPVLSNVTHLPDLTGDDTDDVPF